MAEVPPKERAAMLRQLGKRQKDFERTYAKTLKVIERERPEYVGDVLLPYAVSEYCETVSDWDAAKGGAPPDAIEVVDRLLKRHQWLSQNVSISGEVPERGIRTLAAILVKLREQQREIEKAQKEDVGEDE